MPHRLKTPRWYKKRKIQIQNMDIWNVAFPEGVVIDPNTAWKVFWKTAAAMYGDGGFRVENIGTRSPSQLQCTFVGQYWKKDEFQGEEVSYFNGQYFDYIPTGEFVIDESFFDAWRNDAGFRKGFFDNCSKFQFMPFVDETVSGSRPGIGISVHLEPFNHRNVNVEFYRNNPAFLASMREGIAQHFSSFHGFTAVGSRTNYWRSYMTEKDSIFYFNYFNPEDLGYWGLEYLDMDWTRWWNRIESSDVCAMNLANLVWCDWAITKLRTLLNLDSMPSLYFVFARTSTVVPIRNHDSDQRNRQAILHQFNNPFPVKPLDY